MIILKTFGQVLELPWVWLLAQQEPQLALERALLLLLPVLLPLLLEVLQADKLLLEQPELVLLLLALLALPPRRPRMQP
jgi:hypothetical protein